jgi:hypothetical protein
MKQSEYVVILSGLDDWDSYLLANSNLPGPRANLELVQAVADRGTPELFYRYIALGPDVAPVNSPQGFLAVCGVVGLGRLLTDGTADTRPVLRSLASDPRWRVREAVCMALQRWGDRDINGLIDEMWQWAGGTQLEQRAAIAALCEPRLLRYTRHTIAVLKLLDKVTESLHACADRRRDEFRVLRQALGYCWSVAVAASPENGKPFMEKWCAVDDPDIAWMLKENLKKARLVRVDATWVGQLRQRLMQPAAEDRRV